MPLSTSQLAPGRKTLTMLSGLIAENAALPVPLPVGVVVTPLTPATNKFQAVISIGAVQYIVADMTGKPRTFYDFVAVVSLVVAAGVYENGPTGSIMMEVKNAVVIGPDEYVGVDPKGGARRARARLLTASSKLSEESTKLGLLIVRLAAYAAGPARHRAYLAELEAQKLAVDDSIAYATVEIARLTAVIAA